MRITEENAGRVAALMYTAGSLLAALLFATGAALAGEEWVAVFGGALWVFLLAMIILMSTVTPLIAERLRFPDS